MSMDSTQLQQHLRDISSQATPDWAMPLWDQALALYAHDEVMHACLRLQDEAGADVCELLWACWLDRHGLVCADDVDVALREIRAWQAEVTLPLRRQRRALKARAATQPGVAELRETIKRAELLAERETLTQLQRLAERGQGIRPRTSRDPALAKRLFSWLSTSEKRHFSDLQRLESHLDPPPLPR